MASNRRVWVGVDLDGTLAIYDGWKGIKHIGEPIAPIVQYVKNLIKVGLEVRIMTARCEEGPEAIFYIKEWCKQHIGVPLPVTDRKDFGMVFLIDDRAISVEKNTGKFLVATPMRDIIDDHFSSSNPDSPTYQADGVQ